MKKNVLLIAMLLAGVNWAYAEDVVESYPVNQAERLELGVQGGLLGSAPVYGFGASKDTFLGEFGLSYWRALNVKNDAVRSSSFDLHNLELSYYVGVWSKDNLKVKAGAGIDYVIPNLADGISEVGDNTVGFTPGIKLVYSPSLNYILETGLSGFFASIDTHGTIYGSHMETLSNGQEVEVLDADNFTNKANLNSVLWTVTVKF